jgi:Holin of 3TMs, for gene-transfer release
MAFLKSSSSPAPSQDQSASLGTTLPPTNPAPLASNLAAPAPQPQPSVTVVDVNNSGSAASAVMAQQTVQMASVQATAQAEASVGLAETSIDKELLDQQIKKEEEHWVKAYWRPAMGWLYMAICAMDFILFPVISMFLPILYKGAGLTANYTAWQSLTLSNGGLIHLAFGAILGVTSFMRGQEKLAKING